MSVPSSRSKRSPVSKRQARRMRSTVGSATAGAPTPATAASTGATMPERSVERAPLDRDRFLASVGALRDWITYTGQNATWRLALASVFGCVSTQVPLANETTLARALLFISAVTIGALVGKRLDRKERRKP
jgi:hypothetical protein